MQHDNLTLEHPELEFEHDKLEINMNNIKLHVSMCTNGYRHKPGKSDALMIAKSIASNPVSLSPDDFTDHIMKGHPFSAPQYEGEKMRIDAWSLSNVIVLDFDNDKHDSYGEYLCAEEVIARCFRYGIEPMLVYRTYSGSGNCTKFRAVFVIDGIVSCPILYRHMLMPFTTILPECDQSSNRINKMYYGGTGMIYFDANAVIPVSNILTAYQSYCCDSGMKNGDDRARSYETRLVDLLFSGIETLDLKKAFESGDISAFASPNYSRSLLHTPLESQYLESLVQRIT